MQINLLWTDFERVARTFPSRPAIEDGGRSLTYAELESRARAASGELARAGLGAGCVAGLFLPASIEYATILLGAVKAGIAFMPLNTREPGERLRTVLQKTRPAACVTTAALRSEWADRTGTGMASPPLLLIDRDGRVAPGEAAAATHGPIEVGAQAGYAADCAYIMTTSGSTGTPKIILGSHRGLRHFIRWEIAEFEVNESDRVSFLAAPTFDVSLRDMLVPLLAGGVLCIPGEDIRFDPGELTAWLRTARISHSHMVPTVFRLITRELQKNGHGSVFATLPDLKRVFLAGETLFGDDVMAWRSVAGDGTDLVNLYGPTETTLAKLFHRVTPDDAVPNVSVPLGQPIPDTEVFILKDGHPCSTGETGEITIKTEFASHGYLDRSDSGTASFIRHPPGSDGGIPAYRTGDLGVFTSRGDVRFVGRSDGQIKIRGNRVELSEIEVALRRHPGVLEAAAACPPDGGGDSRIHAYVVAEPDAALTPDGLRRFLADRLPDYMLPSVFVFLERLPRTHSGKVDRLALPRGDGARPSLSQAYAPPAKDLERTLAGIWSQALGIEPVGIRDNFFDLGGTSLLATRVAELTSAAMGRALPVVTLFQYPNIRALAAYLSNGHSAMSEASVIHDRAARRREATAHRRHRSVGVPAHG